MYNRYIPNGTSYTRIPEEETPPHRSSVSPGQSSHYQPPPSGGPSGNRDPLSSLLSGLGFSGKGAGLSGLLSAFRLDDIDTGDILLILLLLFLFREGDDMELVLTLALILLLGLGDKEKEPPPSEGTQELFGA